MKFKYIYYLILLFSTFMVQAQVINKFFLAGRITNDVSVPIENVLISNYSTGIHVHSDSSGLFLLENPSIGDSLKIRAVGFKSRMITIQNLKDTLVVRLIDNVLMLDTLEFSSYSNGLEIFSKIDSKVNPVNSSQEFLRQVPGLFIAQHAGGGKAEQLFLRGFDIDHGTDVNISVDGLPVNMVSHAHGQGYSDLHFVIPETVEEIDYGKGPYEASKGNFATAGYVNLETKKILENNFIRAEYGQFNTQRLLGIYNVLNQSKQKAYIASEYMSTDGPFDASQNFKRINMMGKYSNENKAGDQFSILLSHFSSNWSASGQIPTRSVKEGEISRFGAIDSTEGGETSRQNVSLDFIKTINKKSVLKNNLFYSKYNFELYSNFTFFLFDSINGDQIKQKESRDIIGMSSEYRLDYKIGKYNSKLEIGYQLRNDYITDVELSSTANRKTKIKTIQLGDVNETNLGTYINTKIEMNKWVLNPAIRFDYFNFQYKNSLPSNYDYISVSKNIFSPKLNIFFNQSPKTQYFLRLGKGFHSNDTRVITNEKSKNILPAAYGMDLGITLKPFSTTILNLTYWNLHSEQEFVYVGDAGIIELSGKSQRHGLDIGVRQQLKSWLFFNFDANYALARAIEEPIDSRYIPLAPSLTSTVGVTMISKKGFFGNIKARIMSDRPANEDYSIVAKGYQVVDFSLGYNYKKLDFSLQVLNLFNVKWNETQFATETKLKNEASSVEEIHFTPGSPFFLKGLMSIDF